MIGILKALGATDNAIQQIFLRYALWIAGAGVLAGTGIALILLWLQDSTGFIRLPEEAYYVSKAAVKIIWWQVGAIGLFTLLICFLILLIPSLLVRRIQPVKAIRFN
jgi:lipoprotein-releasing system permease protein